MFGLRAIASEGQAHGGALEQPSPRTVEAAGGRQVLARVIDHHPGVGGVYAAQHDDASDGVGVFWVRAQKGVWLVRGDRVVVGAVPGMEELVVFAVLDGRRTAEVSSNPVNALALRSGESVQVKGADGGLLFSLIQGPQGLTVHVDSPDLELSVKGRLSLSGAEVRLRARAGSATVEASDDVDVRGERVHLNCED